MGSRPPPGCWVPKEGPSPRPGRRMAQEAFEAYGKSSPLPALPHHPFPPGYVPPPVSMGTGGSRHGTLSTMRRRGDYRQGATAAGDPGVRSLYHGEGREGPKENPPPPLQPSASPRACVVLASCLRHACNEGKTTRAPPPPPHTPAPPRVGDAGRGGRKAPPPPEDKAARWGGSGERVRDGPHDRARRKHAPCKPQRGDHRRCERRVGRATTGATRQAPPPPAEGQVPRLMPAPCLRRAYARGRTARVPPPPTPFSPTHPGKGRGQRGGGEGTWGGGQRTDRHARGRDGRRAVETEKKKTKNKANQRARGRKREDRDPNRDDRGEAGATRARKGRW